MEKCPFSERFLQIIWNERLLSACPVCTDGRSVRIISGGLWNRGKGPDFQKAVLLLEGELVRGDVELHRYSSEWYVHGHECDPAYRDVVLHVVWQDDLRSECRQTDHPTLELHSQLLSSWGDFFRTVETAFYPHARQVPPGACALRWALSDDTQLQEILTTAGTARFLRHGRSLLCRGMETGLEQALYEKVFDGLGYSANRQQFSSLAKTLPISVLQEYASDPEALLALLFGTAGLLPDPTQERVLPVFRAWLSRAWKIWWESGLSSQTISWNPYGCRPFNSIYRRLAAGAFWLNRCRCRPLEWLEECRDSCGGDARLLLKSLLKPLECGALWESFRDFQNMLPVSATLLGEDRRRDLAMNILLPLLGAEAELAGRSDQYALALAAWKLLPRSQENRLLKDATLRFLTPPSRWRSVITNAAQQQGMMDIFQDFCLALDHDCHECPFVVTA